MASVPATRNVLRVSCRREETRRNPRKARIGIRIGAVL
jgi:hypothetical protein